MIKSVLLAALPILLFVTPAVASPVGGKQRSSGVVDAGGARGYNIRFQGGEALEISVYGATVDDDDSSTTSGDLDCYLVDENNNIVAKDEGNTNSCLMKGVLKSTAYFRLILKNNGQEDVSFVALAE